MVLNKLFVLTLVIKPVFGRRKLITKWRLVFIGKINLLKVYSIVFIIRPAVNLWLHLWFPLKALLMSEERVLKLLPMFTYKIWVAPLITGMDPHRFPLFFKNRSDFS